MSAPVEVLRFVGFELANGELLLVTAETPFRVIRQIVDPPPVMVESPVDAAPPPARPIRRGRVEKKTTRPRVKSATRKVSGSRVPPEELARRRKVVEAKGLSVAAAELGVSYGALWLQAKQGGWSVPRSKLGPKSARTKTVKAAKVVGSTGAPERRCASCGQRTRWMPCEHCGVNTKASA